MNIDKLKGVIPDSVLVQIPDVISKFQINTPLRLAHFLSQCSHESGNFKAVSENLNYSVDGLKKIFGQYFPVDLATQYATNPEKIASRVYGSRMGNGDESTKEGYKFRGRGFIQLTGKANYQAFDAFVAEDITNNPDLVATKYPLLSAAWFFSKAGLNAVADTGSGNDVITKITKKINGGTNGLDDRIVKLNKFYPLLSQ